MTLSWSKSKLRKRRGKSSRTLGENWCFQEATRTYKGLSSIYILWWTPVCNWITTLWPFGCWSN